MSEIPPIKVIEAIKPTNAGTGEAKLTYKGLSRAVEAYRRTNAKREELAWDSEIDSLDELTHTRQLALECLLRNADRVVNSHEGNRDLWADEFTEASIELYGEPERCESTRLLVGERDFLVSLTNKEGVSGEHLKYLLDLYGSILPDDADNLEYDSVGFEQKRHIREYGEAILDRYGSVLSLVEESGKSEFTPPDLKTLFDDAIEWLSSNDDSDWSEWSAVDVEGTTVSVNSVERTVKIPTQREAVTPEDARGLLAHELLVHAARAKNGYKTGDTGLATGLPGYLDAEEGLGILVEETVSGKVPEKAYDRYIDIALALGTIDGQQRTRQEVFEISFARQLVRAQSEGEVSDSGMESLEAQVWAHVDRIYRGGPGDEIGTRQAIFTKDIAYYVGYKQMAEYVSEQLSSGTPANELFEYLSLAKIDPTNPDHTAKLKQFL